MDKKVLPQKELIRKDIPAASQEMVFHPADSRGQANHGWLDSRQSFSFADYYNPDRMHFGVLRVLNDDRVDPGKGFGRHPHDNMEIISIPLEGELEHADSLGNVAVIKQGDIQVISAGTGIFHSEINPNAEKEVKFLQIWLFPKTRNTSPRYEQQTLNLADRQNKLQQVLSPSGEYEGVSVNQDAWFHMGRFEKGVQAEYLVKKEGNGIYAFVISGSFTIQGQTLGERDALGMWHIKDIGITANADNAEILLMEVPMSI